MIFPYHRNETHFENARRPFEVDQSVLQKKIEGTADTLQLMRRDLFGEPDYYRLVTNAYSMSGTHPRSQRYMRLFAYLPLALRPESENALLLCYGVGITADAFHSRSASQASRCRRYFEGSFRSRRFLFR